MPLSYPVSFGQPVTGLAAGYRQYRLYLPLYNGVRSVEIGVPSGAAFTAKSPREEKPIVYYGTSITHGAVASRPDTPIVIVGSRTFKNTPDVGFVNYYYKIAPILRELLHR